MDFLWIAVAFACGFVARQLGLPPLVGYLLAGFGLNGAGIQPFNGIGELADLGITLMLFTIGLKLNLRELTKLEVWGGATLHGLVWCLLLVAGGLIFIWLMPSLDGHWQQLAAVAFALSFSSTVCVMKILEDSSELKTRHGDLAIGVLVIQDIVAVLFLVAATGKTPSVFALALPLLWFVRPLLKHLLSRCGHGELLVLVGFMIALGGYELFHAVDVKGDLGALIVGMMVAGLPKATELYKSLMSLKDLFLVGFFLNIGFSALPTWDMFGWVVLLLATLPLKFLLFFAIFLLFQLRARTAFLSALALANFSEFGLIVAHQGVDQGWLPESEMVIIALVVAISFVVSSFFYKRAHSIYAQYKHILCRFEHPMAQVKHGYQQPYGAEVLICGMGRVGIGAYHALEQRMHEKVWCVEVDEIRAAQQQQMGYNVVLGDADDIDFWEQLDVSKVRLIMLAIPSIQEMKNIILQLRHTEFHGRIATVARYDDERKELLALGADVVFNYYAEVGAGFAEECAHLLVPPVTVGEVAVQS
ncbi:cation:proton antiporter family protein [Halioxenophilus sp. WMMB6]|uniref:cation:proton antiporter family protein n=1 Tax=Halioxenophilus sp. WMMB6 TaxID=3073815 RepID=UPI00295E7844|nr:cation:proton antiporter family protein [Halioxenophilus sp. WMMB6]